jgi:hypothetical protein
MMTAARWLCALGSFPLLAATACSSSSGGASPGADGGSPSAEAGVDAAVDASSSTPADASVDAADGGSGAGDGDASDAGAGTSPLSYGPLGDGGLIVQFVPSDETVNFDKSQEETSTGTITFGAPNAGASDNQVVNLTRTGGESALGTAGAEEIVSQRLFTFGTFRYRFSLASCATTEEAVNGVFTYFNDGSTAADGLVVNREVDIEILCGEPWFINLTIWTEYTDDSHFVNQSRVVDTRTGTVYVYADDEEGDETGTESQPELMIPGFPQAGAFYEMGFTWSATDLTYFMTIGGSQVTLWDATDATRIPQAGMYQHFNIWAPGEHWSTGQSAGPPANDATLAVDWFRYDPE